MTAAWNEAARSAASEGGSGSAPSQPQRRAAALHGQSHGGFQTRQGDVEGARSEPDAGKGMRVRAAGGGGALEFRPPRIAQPEQHGHLVEGLAHRVVDGGTEDPVVVPGRGIDELGVPSRDDQPGERGREVWILEQR